MHNKYIAPLDLPKMSLFMKKGNRENQFHFQKRTRGRCTLIFVMHLHFFLSLST